MKQIQVIMPHSAKIRFSIQGTGKAVVLLHGYLESLEIWGSFADDLAHNYQVIALDLPGHGQTDAPKGDASTEYMAECIKHVLDHLKIHEAVIIGHSMGGYAMLAFAELYPDMLTGIGLFHSISWADLPEKIEARNREIELVKQGKKQLIYNVNVPKGFADDNLETFKCEVDHAKRIAAATPDDGIIAALNGMKSRKDRTSILETIQVPVFFAIGKKDNYIPVEKLMALTLLPAKKQISIFENSGHMGFIEQKEFAVDEMEQFLKMCF